MKPRLIWTPQARYDLNSMYLNIAQDNELAADRLYRQLQELTGTPCGVPRLGVRRTAIAPSLRMLAHGVYLILYRTSPDRDEGPVDMVEVVRIVDGRRNLSKLFNRN